MNIKISKYWSIRIIIFTVFLTIPVLIKLSDLPSHIKIVNGINEYVTYDCIGHISRMDYLKGIRADCLTISTTEPLSMWILNTLSKNLIYSISVTLVISVILDLLKKYRLKNI